MEEKEERRRRTRKNDKEENDDDGEDEENHKNGQCILARRLPGKCPYKWRYELRSRPRRRRKRRRRRGRRSRWRRRRKQEGGVEGRRRRRRIDNKDENNNDGEDEEKHKNGQCISARRSLLESVPKSDSINCFHCRLGGARVLCCVDDVYDITDSRPSRGENNVILSPSSSDDLCRRQRKLGWGHGREFIILYGVI